MSTPSQFGSSGQYGSYTPSGYGITPSGSAAPARKSVLPENLRAAVIVVGSLATIMVLVQVVNWAMGYRLDQFGIEPRDWSGLWGVLAAPLIHGSWAHLWSNLVPLVIMGVLIMIGGLRQFLAVTVLVWLVSGLGVWLVASPGSVTVGASGVVFGWLTFLIVRGIWTRTWQHILLGLVLLVLYSSLFWTGIVRVAAQDITGVVTVSWQAHLFGAIGGLLAAFLVGRADVQRRNGRRAVTA